MKRNILHFDAWSSFDFDIKYNEGDKLVQNPSHIHNQCEIYLNLSGNVSFEVENNIYPITRGSVIITKPYEYHHCIYHSNELHKHYWILFSSEGNEHLLRLFFNRDTGNKNLIQLNGEELEKFIALLESMLSDKNEIDNRINFLSAIKILQNSKGQQKENYVEHIKKDVLTALNYMDEHISEEITVEQLAKNSFVSVNTLERHFKNDLQSTPLAVLRKKRLIYSAQLLRDDWSITEVCERSGFNDYSNFIQLFRKQFGKTPLQYQKVVKGIK